MYTIGIVPKQGTGLHVQGLQSLLLVLSPAPGGIQGKLELRATAPGVEWATSNPQHPVLDPHMKQVGLPKAFR